MLKGKARHGYKEIRTATDQSKKWCLSLKLSKRLFGLELKVFYKVSIKSRVVGLFLETNEVFARSEAFQLLGYQLPDSK